MEELTLTTPALLFSAVSLILLAYTNRFLSYAQLVRILRDRYMEDPSDINVAQIENLRKRLNLTRMMQVFGIASLFFCVVTMFLIYIGLFLLSIYIFGLALLLLIASLGVSLREIQISTRALDIYLSTMEGKLKHYQPMFRIHTTHTQKVPSSPHRDRAELLQTKQTRGSVCHRCLHTVEFMITLKRC